MDDEDIDALAPLDPAAAALISALVDAVPGLRPLLDEHVDDNEEILSTSFLADVGRWMRGSGMDRMPTALRRATMDWLERAFATGGDLERDVIGTGLVEEFTDLTEDEMFILEDMGPELRLSFAQMFVAPVPDNDGDGDPQATDR